MAQLTAPPNDTLIRRGKTKNRPFFAPFPPRGTILTFPLCFPYVPTLTVELLCC